MNLRKDHYRYLFRFIISFIFLSSLSYAKTSVTFGDRYQKSPWSAVSRRRSAGWVQVDRYTGFAPFNGGRLVTGLLTFLHAIFIFFHSNVNEKQSITRRSPPSFKTFSLPDDGASDTFGTRQEKKTYENYSRRWITRLVRR